MQAADARDEHGGLVHGPDHTLHSHLIGLLGFQVQVGVHHQSFLVGALDHSQDPVQPLSGHVVIRCLLYQPSIFTEVVCSFAQEATHCVIQAHQKPGHPSDVPHRSSGL